MNTDEAVQIVNRWFAYLEQQKAKAARIQELARLAKTDPKEAQHQMRQMDKQPHVFDGAELEPAVRELLTEIERLRHENEMLRDGDTCARMCEGTAYRVEARRLKQEVERLTRERDAQTENATQHFDRSNGLSIENKALKAEIERLREALAEADRSLERAAQLNPAVMAAHAAIRAALAGEKDKS